MSQCALEGNLEHHLFRSKLLSKKSMPISPCSIQVATTNAKLFATISAIDLSREDESTNSPDSAGSD